MESWETLPELMLKKNEPAPYQGVLVPPLNYQNYKEEEKFNNYLYERAKDDKTKIICEDLGTGSWPLHIVFFIIGATLGAVVMSSK